MIRLYCGDCLEVMQDIERGTADMVLADPPYGTTRNKWDRKIDVATLWLRIKRVARPNAAVALFSQLPFASELIWANRDDFRYEWIWQKSAFSGFLNCHVAPMRAHENIVVFYHEKPTYNPQMRMGFKPYKTKKNGSGTNYGKYNAVSSESKQGERYPIDVLQFGADNPKIYPTQKPVALLEYLIKTYTNEGDTVMDFAMGSGSTGIACLNTGRSFIGIEKDKETFELAKQRIENAEHSR